MYLDPHSQTRHRLLRPRDSNVERPQKLGPKQAPLTCCRWLPQAPRSRRPYLALPPCELTAQRPNHQQQGAEQDTLQRTDLRRCAGTPKDRLSARQYTACSAYASAIGMWDSAAKGDSARSCATTSGTSSLTAAGSLTAAWRFDSRRRRMCRASALAPAPGATAVTRAAAAHVSLARGRRGEMPSAAAGAAGWTAGRATRWAVGTAAALLAAPTGECGVAFPG